MDHFLNNFIYYLSLIALGLCCCCAGIFSRCGEVERVPPSSQCRASHCGSRTRREEEHRRQNFSHFSSCGSRSRSQALKVGSQAQLPRGMWDCLEPETQPTCHCWQADSPPLSHQETSVSFLIVESQFPDLLPPLRGSLQKLSCTPDLSALLHR